MDRGAGIEGGLGHSGIQPAAIEIAELEAFESSKEAQHLARLVADTELMLRLSVEGFEGDSWRQVSRALVEYGYTVMRAWVVTGQVFGKLKQRHRQVPEPPPGGIPRDEALVLASDCVADAIVHFRDKVLKRGQWDSAKGASLTTFFIGNCLLFQFPNLYRKWRSEQSAGHRTTSLSRFDSELDETRLHESTVDDPAELVAGAESSRRRVAELIEPLHDKTNEAIMLLVAENYSIDEIAEILGLDYGVVESRLYRARQRLGRRRGA